MTIFKKIWRGFKIFLLLFSIYGVLWVCAQAGLNYMGYCSEKGRILSDNEMIRLAIERTINSMRLSSNGKKKYVLYKDVNDFLAKNPNCCSFGVHVRGSEGFEYVPPLTYRITGTFRGYVTLKYTSIQIDQSGMEHKTEVQGNTYMTNCKASHF